ncbi:O-antigen ligase family protein [Pseudomonas petrae]|uniref:O-antigen ligase family protein n=1 Tax=Pseudomonas petrae TaxID=2912190 RepID=A0ABS9IEI4_9PSED|nr:O-antigen ligase family protein [Pseudomonas petrae]MCF7545716.1 O-antigen ligase family protein [Pseudomonas petrae]
MSRKFIFFAGLFFFLLIAPVTLQVFGDHDSQRVFQLAIVLFLLMITLFGPLVGPQKLLPLRSAQVVSITLVALAFNSITLAHQPAWAFTELALIASCIGSSLIIAQRRRGLGHRLDRLLWILVIILCTLKCVQFGAGLLAAFTSGFPTLDTDILLEGFSNKRFYGQFQTFTLPLLAFPLLAITRPMAKKWAFVLLSCWWVIAISGGTRGTWMGMAGAAAVLALCGIQGRRWVGWQMLAVLAGATVFWLLFSFLPSKLDIEVVNFAGDRLSTSLSAREIIWHQAWEMIKERPLLGFGPMHFADIPNPVAAHPHQAILQWACEWGIPSTLLVMWLVSKGLWATFRLIRANHRSTEPVDLLRVCLFASLIGALAQSMVDGVIVMPYSQLWLAIVVGWLIGIHEFSTEPPAARAIAQKGWVAILTLAVAYLGYIAVRDAPNLEAREQAYIQEHGGRFQPRFWMQGVIAKPAGRLLEQTNADNFAPLATPK